jgi:Excinuclease ATPase subunit
MKEKKQEFITIEGARVNNLKNISLKIPRGKLVVISGLSGSGKSSLAFETLFAEGQRRFAESLSSFARQFLGRMSKPAVDKIEGIPPAIAIEQKVNTRNPRSTVGTSTEIYDYLRLLYAKIGRTYSPISGKEVKCNNVNDVINFVKDVENKAFENVTVYVLAKVNWEDNPNKVECLLSLKDAGFGRFYSNNKIVRLDNILQDIESYSPTPLYLMIDRYLISKEKGAISEDEITRLQDSIQTAFNEGNGTMYIATDSNSNVKYYNFSNLFEADGIKFEQPNELMFSYNNPIGACPVCKGADSLIGIDEKLVIPNASLSIYEGAIACWRGEKMGEYLTEFIYAAPKYSFPIHKPYAELTKEQKNYFGMGAEILQE